MKGRDTTESQASFKVCCSPSGSWIAKRDKTDERRDETPWALRCSVMNVWSGAKRRLSRATVLPK